MKKLSTYQYFEVLQIEWVVADLRCRIFTKERDKNYWYKVREGKRVKIENIAKRNNLPTIFTDTELKRDLERNVFNDWSYPDFHYKDEDHKKMQGYWDLFEYYAKDVEVRYEFLGEMRIGKVVDYIPFAKEIRVQNIKTSEIETVLVSKTIRIL